MGYTACQGSSFFLPYGVVLGGRNIQNYARMLKKGSNGNVNKGRLISF